MIWPGILVFGQEVRTYYVKYDYGRLRGCVVEMDRGKRGHTA